MREIKFRAWDASEKEMVCWPSLYNDPDDWFIGLITNEGVDESDVLMQFTGLHDKNGKEIYEGDVVKQGSTTAPVKWNECMWFVESWTLSQFLPCVVVGNVYENPELLKSNE